MKIYIIIDRVEYSLRSIRRPTLPVVDSGQCYIFITKRLSLSRLSIITLSVDITNIFQLYVAEVVSIM